MSVYFVINSSLGDLNKT